MSEGFGTQGLLDALQQEASPAKEEPGRAACLGDLLEEERDEAELLALCEEARADLEAGRFDRRVARNAALVIGSAHKALLQSIVDLLDFAICPSRETAQDLDRVLAACAMDLEGILVKRSITDPFKVIERSFGLGIEELAQLCRVKLETVKRWISQGRASITNHYKILPLAEAAAWLRQAGMDETQARLWFEAPNPALTGNLSPHELLFRNGLRSSLEVCDLAMKRYERGR